MVNRLYNFGSTAADCGNSWCDIPIKAAPASPSVHQNTVLLVCVQGSDSDRVNFEYHIQETFRLVQCHIKSLLFLSIYIRGWLENIDKN